MLLTKDYLKKDPWEAIVARINDAYQTELEPYTTQLLSIDALGPTSTRIVIAPNQSISPTSTAPAIVRTEYVYDRLDLANFFIGGTIKQLSGMAVPVSSFDVLDAIGELNDIKFTLNDFLHLQFDEYGTTYTLTANPKSLRFVGSVKFQLINTTKRLLSNLGSKLEYPVANTWPAGTDGTKLAAQYMTSGYDFSGDRDLIRTITAESVWPSGGQLAAALQLTTGQPWTCAKTKVDWNIAFEVKNGEPRFRVLYNGPILPRYTFRTDMLNVLVLQLGTLSENIGGYLLIHYN